jgi:TATA-box binding protein (TBP) (component of TFIID and TFIIIB)
MSEVRYWKDPVMVNVVVTGRLRLNVDDHEDYECDGRDCVIFDLGSIARQLDNVEYYPDVFAALKIARLSPFSKGLFFKSGKLVCVGNTSVANARESIAWFADKIASCADMDVRLKDVVVQNIVATTNLGGGVVVPLLEFAKRWTAYAQYEPELFPGCPIRHPTWPSTVVVNLFSSGCMNVTGAKTAEDVHAAAVKVARLVRSILPAHP